MIYTELTKKALNICFEAHKDQRDKCGMPYVFHPFHIAEQMKDELTTAAALLHDVVEDTPLTFEDLEKEGFPPKVIAALKALTRSPETDYMDYIEGIKDNDIAVTVKLEDLRHNSDLSRYGRVTEADLKRNKKYLDALEYLEQYVTGND